MREGGGRQIELPVVNNFKKISQKTPKNNDWEPEISFLKLQTQMLFLSSSKSKIATKTCILLGKSLKVKLRRQAYFSSKP